MVYVMQPRNFEVNGIYHVYNRGYEKRNVFLEDKDYTRFIESLYWFNNEHKITIDHLSKTERSCALFTPSGSTANTNEEAYKNIEQRILIVEILAFCLMSNHYHLILREITSGGISMFMKKLGNGYTAYFNEKYDRKGVGGLFQGRFQSKPIKNDIQLSNIFAYVHTNPIELVEPQWKELMVKDKERASSSLKEYQWSSVHDYCYKSIYPNIIQKNFYLNYFDGADGCIKNIESWINFKAENYNSFMVDHRPSGSTAR